MEILSFSLILICTRKPNKNEKHTWREINICGHINNPTMSIDQPMFPSASNICAFKSKALFVHLPWYVVIVFIGVFCSIRLLRTLQSNNCKDYHITYSYWCITVWLRKSLITRKIKICFSKSIIVKNRYIKWNVVYVKLL